MESELKRCSKCGEVKARTEFNKCKRSKDGLRSECRVCNKASAAKYRAANPEKFKARVSKWSKANPDRRRAYNHRRRAKKRDAQGSHTSEQLKARFDYHGNKCVYCDSTENLHADHQIPLSRGGTNFASNMVPACATCNISKGSKTPEEFLVCQFNIAMEKLING